MTEIIVFNIVNDIGRVILSEKKAQEGFLDGFGIF